MHFHDDSTPDPSIADLRGRALPSRIAEWGLPIVLLAPMIFLPLGRDQGIFAYVGQVILDGGVPYRDVFEIKGPGLHYAYAAAMALFGETAIGVRLFFFGVALVGTRLAADLAERLAGSPARLPAAVCYALTAVQAGTQCHWDAGQAEDLILPLTLGGILLLDSVSAKHRLVRTFGAGLLFGVACLVKPTAAVACGAVLATAAVMTFRESGGERRRFVWRVVATGAGLIVPALMVGSYFAATGSLDDCWTMVVLHNMQYAGRSVGGGFEQALWPVGWRAMAMAALAGALLVGRRGGLCLALLVAGSLAGWLTVIWQGKYFGYHWTPAIGCMAVLAGCGIGRGATIIAGSYRRPRLGRWVGRMAIAAGLVVLGPRETRAQARLLGRTVDVLAGRTELAAFRAPYASGSTSAAVTTEVARYLRARTRNPDTILVWGHETIVNFESDRRSPTRFVIDGPLSPGRRFAPAWREELLRDVTRRPPRYIVVVERDANLFEPDDSWTSLREFPALLRFLDRNYVDDGRIERFRLFRYAGVR